MREQICHWWRSKQTIHLRRLEWLPRARPEPEELSTAQSNPEWLLLYSPNSLRAFSRQILS